MQRRRPAIRVPGDSSTPPHGGRRGVRACRHWDGRGSEWGAVQVHRSRRLRASPARRMGVGAVRGPPRSGRADRLAGGRRSPDRLRRGPRQRWGRVAVVGPAGPDHRGGWSAPPRRGTCGGAGREGGQGPGRRGAESESAGPRRLRSSGAGTTRLRGVGSGRGRPAPPRLVRPVGEHGGVRCPVSGVRHRRALSNVSGRRSAGEAAGPCTERDHVTGESAKHRWRRHDGVNAAVRTR